MIKVDPTIKAAIDLENSSVIESLWQFSELQATQETIIAIGFGDLAIPGTAKQWQDYWLALRDWKAGNPDFPDMSKRPIRPS